MTPQPSRTASASISTSISSRGSPVKTVVRVKPQDTKVVRISTTLELMDIHVSEPMLPFIKANPSMFEIVGSPEPFKFDAKGNLYPMLGRQHHEKVPA